MEFHPAVVALKRGCVCRLNPEVSHWPELAHELVNFLKLKYANDEDIACGGDVEELWRFMLLDTSIADGIHAMLGGPVPHSTASSAPSAQALSINMLLRDGFAVHTRFWNVPGLAACRVRMPGKDDSFIVYGLITPAGIDLTTAGMALGVDPVLLVPVPLAEESFQLVVKKLTEGTRTFLMSSYDRVSDLKAMILDKEGITCDQQQLLWSGGLLDDSMTAQSLGLKRADTVLLVLKLRGC